MARVRPKADDERLMIAIDSGCVVGPDGAQYDVTAGQRLYSSRPVVKLAPNLFAAADLDDLDLQAARRALLEHAIEAVGGVAE